MLKVSKGQAVKLDGKQSLFVSFKYNPMYVAKIKSMPTRWYHPADRTWEIPVEDLNLLILKFGEQNIQLEGIEAEDTEEREDIRERLRDIKPIIDFRFRTKPYPHQIEAFNYGLQNRVLLIGDEQGLGKTKEAIDVMVARKGQDGITGVLVICGVNNLKYNWLEEIKTHSKEKARVIEGSTKERAAMLKKDLGKYFFHIINLEAIRKNEIVRAIVKLIDDGKIQAVIVDEIHKAKNGMSQQGENLRKINPPIKMALTGTPLMNKPHDLWNILVWLEVEKSNFYQFRHRYCVMGGYKNKQVVGYKNLDELSHKLNKVMLRRKKDEVLDLPEKIYSTEYIELTERQKIIYNNIREGILQQINEILTLPNPLSALIRLRQCTISLDLLDAGKDEPKLDRVVELVEEITEAGHKVVIFSQWTKVVNKLRKKLKKFNPAYITGEVKVEDRKKMEDRFQEDKRCKVIIGTIGAMGTGLTLTAGSYVIFTDKDWNQVNNEQAEDRLHRIGQDYPVNIITMIARGSIDERVEEILKEKAELFRQVVEGEARRVDRRVIERLLMELAG